MRNLFETMKDMTEATAENTVARKPMTQAHVDALKAKLKAEYRMNVHPNKFDMEKPYKVSIRFNGEFTNHGNFTDLEAATMVGSIVSLARFGAKARKGHFDLAAAMKSEEFKAWMEDERNEEVIALAEANSAAMGV